MKDKGTLVKSDVRLKIFDAVQHIPGEIAGQGAAFQTILQSGMGLVLGFIASDQILTGKGILAVEKQHFLLAFDLAIDVFLVCKLKITQQGDCGTFTDECHLVRHRHEVAEIFSFKLEHGEKQTAD
ncbi:hypothetical protein DSECCO2_593070 [anaerobic digester metagenome]